MVNTFSGESANGISEASQYPKHKPNFVKLDLMHQIVKHLKTLPMAYSIRHIK